MSTEIGAAAVQTPSAIADEKDRKFFADLLINLESAVDVNAIVVADLRLWPLIRWELGREIKGTAAVFGIDESVDRMRASGFAGAREERIELAKRQRQDERARYPDPRVQIDQQNARLRAGGACDFAVFSKVEKYYQPLDGKYYAPVLDPVYEDLSKRGRTRMLALEPLDLVCHHEPERFSADPYMRTTSALQKEDVCAPMRERLEKINEVLRDLAPGYRLDIDRLNNRLNRYRRRVQLFEDVLRAVQPKAIFCSSFVGWAPLIWAARRLGIVSVDIQHGGQSSYHYHTTHWSSVPPQGYELLPDIFWVWGEEIRRFITPWLPGGATRHKAVVGGNRYVAKCRREFASLTDCDDGRNVLSCIARGERAILVTLGYSIDEILPGNLLQAIKSTPEWVWLLRLHPINRGEAAVQELRTKIAANGLANVEYESSTRLPLYALFTQVDFHITAFSTTCREAKAMGVESAIIHPIGRTYFADEIAAGIFAYAEEPADIIKTVQGRVDALSDADSPPAYIATDDALVDDILKAVGQARIIRKGID